MKVGQLDGVGDVLDLAVEPTDVGVRDVRDLLEHDLLHPRPGQLLEQEPRTRIHQHRVTGPKLGVGQVLGDLGHPLLVGPAHAQGAAPVLEDLGHDDDLASRLVVASKDHVERLVEDDLLPLAQVVEGHVRVQRHAHLASAGKDVDGAVVVGLEVGAIGSRGLGQLLHLVAQGGDVLLCLLEGEGQLLILRDRMAELALGLEEALLERADTLGCLLQPATKLGNLVFCLLGSEPKLLCNLLKVQVVVRILRDTHLSSSPPRVPTVDRTLHRVVAEHRDGWASPSQHDVACKAASWPTPALPP